MSQKRRRVERHGKKEPTFFAFAFAFLVTRWAQTLPVRIGRLCGTVALRKVQKLFCCKGNIPRELNLWSILHPLLAQTY